MEEEKYIGVKKLGELALVDFCPRCFWFEYHYGPFPSRFPGIFNVLDNVSKKSVDRSLLQRKKLPDWLNISDVVKQVRWEEIGTVKKIKNRDYLVIQDKKSGWILRGQPDKVFELKDGTLHIIDFKTARFTSRQNELFPLYEAQLNGYALLAHKKPVSRLSLVYCEPKSELSDDINFHLEFSIKIDDIDLNRHKVFDLLKRAKEILEKKEPPLARPGCGETCFYIDKILGNQF